MTWITYGSKAVKEMYYCAWNFPTQWPCSDWFHVPTKTDWDNVYNAWVALWQWSSTDWNNMRIKLKIPFVWNRSRSNSNVTGRWTTWYYWTSTSYSSVWWSGISINNTSINSEYWSYKSVWCSIRPFRNTPLIPNSSWKVIYAWSNWAWIYHNDDEWVISISSNWTTWYSISDKNLWATQVYNDWDALSENNSGKYYQWWNNNGFNFTWTLTTSTNQVDASSYWPWNYYSSNTFIIRSASPYDWSSVRNDNLWWWVTWNITIYKKIKEAYYGNTKIRPSPYLCFTANIDWSTIQLNKKGEPRDVSLEISQDALNRSDYIIWDTITLNNAWDKIYMRNKSETPVNFSMATYAYYQFAMTWSIAASWDCNFLLCKYSTKKVTHSCFCLLFQNCRVLTSPPELPATELGISCYHQMFQWCTSMTTAPHLPATDTIYSNSYYYMFRYCENLTTLPILPAKNLMGSCYMKMFEWCTKIKISTTQTWEYQTEYRIPYSWTWTQTDSWTSLNYMFDNTWWTFTWTPEINTTYYTSNTLV